MNGYARRVYEGGFEGVGVLEVVRGGSQDCAAEAVAVHVGDFAGRVTGRGVTV